VLWVAAGMFAVSAFFALWRIVRGPSALDRIVATDVIIAVVIGSIAIITAMWHNDSGLPMVMALSLLGFSGAVAMARLITGTRLGSGQTLRQKGPKPAPRERSAARRDV
jgi:multicomponent Na+:H+ antiporter subunit F